MSGSAPTFRFMSSALAQRLCPAVTKAALLALCAVPAMACLSIQAQAIDRTGVLFNSVPLACWIENEKVIAVVNSTGKTLPAGTRLSVDAVRIPDGTHYKKGGTIARTPSGGIIRMGAVPSSSCTASARLPMPVLKTQ